MRRFAEEWEVEASLGQRARDPAALGAYEARGRLAGGSREEVIEAAFAVWQDAWAGGESMAVLARRVRP